MSAWYAIHILCILSNWTNCWTGERIRKPRCWLNLTINSPDAWLANINHCDFCFPKIPTLSFNQCLFNVPFGLSTISRARKGEEGDLGEQLLPPLSPRKSPARKAAVKSAGYWNGQKNREKAEQTKWKMASPRHGLLETWLGFIQNLRKMGVMVTWWGGPVDNYYMIFFSNIMLASEDNWYHILQCT